jgi:hypothetical protein
MHFLFLKISFLATNPFLYNGKLQIMDTFIKQYRSLEDPQISGSTLSCVEEYV